MNRFVLLILVLLAGTASADVYQDAVDHPQRPDTDREDDDRRRSAEVMAFTGLSPGDVAIEIGAGRGHTTELAARIVGDEGKVYANYLDPARVMGNRLPNVVALPAESANPDKIFSDAGITRGTVDVVIAFYSLHDSYLDENTDVSAWYRALYEILKSGGVFVVFDNVAVAGSELEHASGLHRIDPEFLRDEILAHGFEFDAESHLLRNADDDLMTLFWEDTDSRKAGYQDRFGFKFRKP